MATKYVATEAYGVVWVALERPRTGVMPAFPREVWGAYGWRSFLSQVDTWHASAGRVLENLYLPWCPARLDSE